MIFGLVYYTLGLFALIGIYPAFRYTNSVIGRLFTKKASVPVTVVLFFATAALFYEVHTGVLGIIGWAIKIAFVAFGVFKIYPIARELKNHTDERVAKIDNWQAPKGLRWLIKPVAGSTTTNPADASKTTK